MENHFLKSLFWCFLFLQKCLFALFIARPNFHLWKVWVKSHLWFICGTRCGGPWEGRGGAYTWTKRIPCWLLPLWNSAFPPPSLPFPFLFGNLASRARRIFFQLGLRGRKRGPVLYGGIARARRKRITRKFVRDASAVACSERWIGPGLLGLTEEHSTKWGLFNFCKDVSWNCLECYSVNEEFGFKRIFVGKSCLSLVVDCASPGALARWLPAGHWRRTRSGWDISKFKIKTRYSKLQLDSLILILPLSTKLNLISKP